MSGLDKLAGEVSALLVAVLPTMDLLAPGAGKAVSVATDVLKAAIAAEPAAVALIDQIKSGKPITAEQMSEIDAAYDDAQAKLEADIAAARSRT